MQVAKKVARHIVRPDVILRSLQERTDRERPLLVHVFGCWPGQSRNAAATEPRQLLCLSLLELAAAAFDPRTTFEILIRYFAFRTWADVRRVTTPWDDRICGHCLSVEVLEYVNPHTHKAMRLVPTLEIIHIQYLGSSNSYGQQFGSIKRMLEHSSSILKACCSEIK